MAINKHNYEAYFLDYHEGNLKEEDMHMLMAFLDANPELKEEFYHFENIVLKPNLDISFTGKGGLKKHRIEKQLLEDQTMIALLEGDLDTKERVHTEALIQEDGIAKASFEAYKQSISHPDLTIQYPAKEKLRKRAGLIILPARTFAYAAAAVIVVLIGISSLLIFNSKDAPQEVRQSLAKTDLAEIESLEANTGQIILHERIQLHPQMSYMAREYAGIPKLSSASAKQIDHTYSYTHSYLAQYRPSSDPRYGFTFTDEAIALADQSKEKTLMGRVLSGFFNRVSTPLKGDDNKREERSGNFSVWDIAEFGVKGVNALGDHEYTMVRQYNEKGNVKGILILEEQE